MNELANLLPNLIAQAIATLDKATTAAEVLEARDHAAFAYDEAKAAERLAKAKHAHDTVIAACRQAQADALTIEALAQCRLADEYDAAQERGEAAKPGGDRTSIIPSENNAAKVADIGLTSKIVHEARKVRDAERKSPGIIRKTLSEQLSKGEAPTRAAIKRAIEPKPAVASANTFAPHVVTPAAKPAPAPQPSDAVIAALTKELAAAKAASIEARTEIDRLRAENVKLSDPKALEIQKRTLEYEYEVRARTLENEYIARLTKQVQDSVPPLQISGGVASEVNRWLEVLLPELHKERSKARKAVAKRKRVVSRAAFNKLRFAVASDTGPHQTAKERDTATLILNELKPHVLDEKDEPTQWDSDLPNDLAGWAKRLADVELKRRMRGVPQPKGMPLPPFLRDPKMGSLRR
jgi:hypothetical protein